MKSKTKLKLLKSGIICALATSVIGLGGYALSMKDIHQVGLLPSALSLSTFASGAYCALFLECERQMTKETLKNDKEENVMEK